MLSGGTASHLVLVHPFILYKRLGVGCFQEKGGVEAEGGALARLGGRAGVGLAVEGGECRLLQLGACQRRVDFGRLVAGQLLR